MAGVEHSIQVENGAWGRRAEHMDRLPGCWRYPCGFIFDPCHAARFRFLRPTHAEPGTAEPGTWESIPSSLLL